MTLFTVFVIALVVSAHAYTLNRVAPVTSGAVEIKMLPAAQFSTPLIDKIPRRAFKRRMLTRASIAEPSNYTSILQGGSLDSEYLAEITIGGQNFKVIVDTGSSDTWLAKKGFQCYTLDGSLAPQSQCRFGTPGFDESLSTTFVSYPNMNINLSYADNEFLYGDVGFETVTVGGMTVTSQEIGLMTHTAWNGDGVNTGLLGLAYPGITNVYNGTNPNADVRGSSVKYFPFFFTAVLDNIVSNPYFSIALNRGSFLQNDQNLGFLAFGGIAPVDTTIPTATIPIKAYTISESKQEFNFYTIDIGSYIIDGLTDVGSGTQGILDSGTNLLLVPTEVAQVYNAKFVPPATLVDGTYFVDCNAIVPTLEVEIGGKRFSIDSKDQILPGGVDADGNIICKSGTQDGGVDPSVPNSNFILGDVFLHNVVVTHNIQSNQVTLTQRAPY